MKKSRMSSLINTNSNLTGMNARVCLLRQLRVVQPSETPDYPELDLEVDLDLEMLELRYPG